MKTTSQKQEILNQFIINVTLIDPIKKIITNLENKNYRDCDVKWLDSKLEAYVKLTCETLGVKGLTIPSSHYTILNEYVYTKYLGYFNNLLSYFKDF